MSEPCAISINSEIRKKSFNLSTPHFLRVSFVVKKVVTLNPSYITLFGAEGVVLASYGLTNSVKEFLWRFFIILLTPIDPGRYYNYSHE